MFSIIKGGCFARHSSEFIMERPNGLPYYLFLIIKSEASLNINGQTYICKPNSAIIISPDTPYFYKNPNGDYIDDWLHFNCDINDFLPYDSLILNKCFPISDTRLLTTYIQQILWENNYTLSDSKDYYVDTIFRIILKHLNEDIKLKQTEDYNPYRYKLQKLRLEIQSAPYKTYCINDISSELNISTSYFQYLYKLFFNISFRKDIINMKVDYAKELICYTTQSIEEIAYNCGYSNEVHFYRQFLSKTGMTPGEYRKLYKM